MATIGAQGPLPFMGALARSGRREDRQLWLRVAVDYVLRADRPENDLDNEFADNFARCLGDVDDDARLVIGQRLLASGRAPDRLLASISGQGGEAGAYILTRSKDISRRELLAAAADPVRAGAVARRDEIDGELIDALFADAEIATLLALLDNPSAKLETRHLRELVARAKVECEAGDRRLAERIFARAPIRAEYAPLFLFANSAQRAAILLAMQRAELAQPRQASPAAAPRASIARLEAYALAGETDRFAATLAEILGCPEEIAARIACDPNGEPLAAALAAIGAPNDVGVRILTASDLRDGLDYRRVGALARLQNALSPLAAQRVVAAMIGPWRVLDPRRPLPLPPRETPAAAASSERRSRAPDWRAPLRQDNLTPAVLRRRRAFAFQAAYERRGD